MMPDFQDRKYQEILQAQQHEIIEQQFIERQVVNIYDELSDVLTGLSQLMLISACFSSEQSTHLTNLIEVTQNTKVQSEQVQYLQSMMNKINPKEMRQTPSFNELKQSEQQQHSFKFYVKKNQQQTTLDKLQNVQSSIINPPSLEASYHIIKTHCCPLPQTKAKYPIPKKYSQIEAHYSPKNLKLYLNKDHPGFGNNTKWLKQEYQQEERAHSVDIQLSQQMNPIQQLRQSLLIQSHRIKNSQNLSRYQSIQEQFKQTFTAKLDEDEYTKNRAAARSQISPPPQQQQNRSSSRKQEQKQVQEDPPRKESLQHKGKLKTLFENVDSNSSFKELGKIVYDANDQHRVSDRDLSNIQQQVMRLSRKISTE